MSALAGRAGRASLFALAGLLSVLALPSCGGGGGGGSGGGGQAASKDLASVKPNPQDAAFNSEAGAFAADYLHDTTFTDLVVEVDYPVSRPPTAAALDLLQTRLEERCNKPGGVTILLDDAIADAEFPDKLSVADLEDLEHAHRSMFANQGTGVAVLYLLYVKGHSTDDTNQGVVLGLSYLGSSLALFADNADQGPNPFVTTAEVEATGIAHESGHMLGLVNGGVPKKSDHEDSAHPFHCTASSCLMYWQINVPLTSPNLGDPDFAQYDQACIDDLQAFGGK